DSSQVRNAHSPRPNTWGWVGATVGAWRGPGWPSDSARGGGAGGGWAAARGRGTRAGGGGRGAARADAGRACGGRAGGVRGVGGLMGFRPDDERLRTALEIAEQEGLDYRFEKTTLADDAHPNTVRLTLERGDRHAVMTGSSLGAGRVLVTEIDGYPVEVTGNL